MTEYHTDQPELSLIAKARCEVLRSMLRDSRLKSTEYEYVRLRLESVNAINSTVTLTSSTVEQTPDDPMQKDGQYNAQQIYL